MAAAGSPATPPPCSRPRATTVAYCLELGDDINAANDLGQTPIVGAVYFRSPAMVQFLVDRGAKINVVNKRGQTPWLITQGEYRSGSFFVDKETGDYLVKLGADVTLGKDLGTGIQKAGTIVFQRSLAIHNSCRPSLNPAKTISSFGETPMET